MEPEFLVKEGMLNEALEALKDRVRKFPAKHDHRLFLFQLFAVMGDWERALTQLNVASDMNADSMALGQVYGPALQAEALRASVFSGAKTPVFFGEPAEWMVKLTQALTLFSRGELAAAASLRDQAFEEAPSISGKIDGVEFEWIADADPRLGPVWEAVIQGKYYWMPMSVLREVRLEAPVFLKDSVWAQAHFIFTQMGEAHGLVPVRYPGSEKSASAPIRMARHTEWEDRGHNYFIGLGQRMLATDAGEYPLLGVRNVSYNVNTDVQIADILTPAPEA